ncbi:hypothetical protein PHSY_006586 [Pseudozyma hubeiensis SY62]|uniref:Uncharacterized protein n=1 Tax=Pseudozyma hubeiensis (strain SY62) TaxID=1305764 RepID=R9PCA9_PSEHS|nr:hypothetical protein PHSY_006586 [Pseudozyma hubeiensis SY62]GAC98989.1 hypothetical protein PHSY_006586 [Pseudozyma hubeiensis SY62]
MLSVAPLASMCACVDVYLTLVQSKRGWPTRGRITVVLTQFAWRVACATVTATMTRAPSGGDDADTDVRRSQSMCYASSFRPKTVAAETSAPGQSGRRPLPVVNIMSTSRSDKPKRSVDRVPTRTSLDDRQQRA